MSMQPDVTRRRRTRRLSDVALAVGIAASAAAMAANGVNDARQTTGWPRWLELIYLVAFLVGVPGLLVAGWARFRLRAMGAVVDDERSTATHVRAMAVALVGALCAQLPYLFDVETASVAQAKFTIAAALVTYGVARLWFNRES